MGFTEFPNASEFFSIFWNGVLVGMREIAAFFFSSIDWLFETLARWF